MKNKIILSILPLLINSNLSANTDKEVNIELKTMSLEDFVSFSSKILKKNIVSKENLTRKIKFYSASSINKKNFNSIIGSVLSQNNMLLIEKENYIELISKKDFKDSAPVLKKDLKGLNDYSIISYSIPCKSYKAQTLKNKLFYFNSKIGKLISDEINNKLIIIDYVYKVKQIEQMAIELNESEDINPNQIILKNKLSQELYKMILKYSTYISFYKIKEKFDLIPNYKNNSISVLASKGFTAEIKKYIKVLENNVELVSIVKNYNLNNALAEEVEKTINKIISIKKDDKKPEYTLTIDKELNSVIVYAPNYVHEKIKKLINILDIPRKQVYVKASIIEVNEGDLSKLGVKYGIDGIKATDNGLISLGANLTGTSLAGGLPTLLGNTLSGESLSDAFLLGLSVEFLKNKNVAEVLSEPSILCVNNKASNIYVGETESILNSTSAPSTGGIVKNFSREDIGLSLEIKPRILQNEKINMQIPITLEGIVRKESIEVGTPTTTKRTIDTNAIVKTGKSVIVGGLIKKDNTEIINKIPLLGDIPYIGEWLFTYTNNEERNTSLVVILTPYIINNYKDFDKVRKKLNQLEKIQQKIFKKYLDKEIKEKEKEKEDVDFGSWDD